MKRVLLVTALVATGATACDLESLFPQPVAEGVARLTVVNAAGIVQLVEDDTTCGFRSADVLAGAEIAGEPGGEGTATWRVEACEIDVAAVGPFAEGCDGAAMRGAGVVRVTATRKIHGLLTGDAAQPVVPGGPDAVEIEVHVVAEDFHLERDGQDNALTMKSGALDYVVRPRLAVGFATPGVCSVPTPNLRFESVAWTDGVVDVHTPERTFEAQVPWSRFSAQIGKGPEVENVIEGELQVWGESIRLDRAPLDETYDAAAFQASYADAQCNAAGDKADRLALPISFTCDGPDGLIAAGAARLSIRQLGAVVPLINDDAGCGFDSADVLAALETDASAGGPGTATWTVDGCTLRFPEDTVVAEDCNGVQTLVSGSVTVSGTKTLSGWLAGSAETPVVPLDDLPVAFDLDVTYDNFRVRTTAGAEGLTVRSGSASGTVAPRIAVAAESGTCSIPSAHARVSDVFIGESDVEITSASGTFRTVIDEATLSAVNGAIGEEQNRITGRITIDGESHDVSDLPDAERLDPFYDAAGFDASYTCREDLAQPVSFDCAFDLSVATGASRLTVDTFGQVAQAIEADRGCGFQSPDVLQAPALSGELGRPGASATWTVEECVLNFDEPVAVSENCNGDSSFLAGRVIVTGEKTIEGISTGDPLEPIVPTTWQPATLDLTMRFLGLEVSASNRDDSLYVRSGELSGQLKPRVAIDEQTGACSVPLPIARFAGLAWSDGLATIRSGEDTVDVRIDDSSIAAVNGNDGTHENHLEGTITIAGETYDATAGGDGLNPRYDADEFVAGYACTTGMSVPQASDDCSFTRVLAEGAARLIVQATGEVASMINADTDCGFDATDVLTSPTVVEGDPGEMGRMGWRIESCDISVDADDVGTPAATDCLGKSTFRSGGFTFTGERDVTGVREEIGFLGITIADSIVPSSHDAVTVRLEDVALADFKSWSENEDGTSADLGVLTIHSGSLAAGLDPVLGANAGEDGTFDVPTPVSALGGVRLTDAEVTLVSDGKTFKLHVDDTDLAAFNGTYNGRSNEIDGTITLEGETFSLAGQSLNPEFTQDDFDARYACTEDLADVIPSAGL